jgi:hypothetical protein
MYFSEELFDEYEGYTQDAAGIELLYSKAILKVTEEILQYRPGVSLRQLEYLANQAVRTSFWTKLLHHMADKAKRDNAPGLTVK